MAFPDTLPPDVLDALNRGKPIEAIKRLRKATGLGLAEAKSMIDSHLRSGASGAASFRPAEMAERAADAGRMLPEQVLEALRRGDKIGAIKVLRERTGLGLAEAKNRIEAAGVPEIAHRLDHRIEAPRERIVQSRPGLAPGEVPNSNAAFWWVLFLAITALVGYYLLD